jgi:hypothetical protein
LFGQIGRAEEVTISVTEKGEGIDHSGRAWTLGDDGETWERKFGGISASERRTAFALRKNVEAFADHYQRANCGFLTLTPLDGRMTPKQFGEVWHLIRKNHLKWVRSYLRVLEPQKRGAPHYHLCVAVDFDMLPDQFNWDALQLAGEARKRGDLVEARRLTRVYAESAAKRLRECWAELREVCARYGLGRSEFLPFRKGSGAIAAYVGKYLEGGLEFRQASWKGARRVEYDRKESRVWKRAGVRFGWVSPGAREWRSRCAELGAAAGARDSAELAEKLGPKWCYHARKDIMTAPLPRWLALLRYVAASNGVTPEFAVRPVTVGGVMIADLTAVMLSHYVEPGEEPATESVAKQGDESGQAAHVIAGPPP